MTGMVGEEILWPSERAKRTSAASLFGLQMCIYKYSGIISPALLPPLWIHRNIYTHSEGLGILQESGEVLDYFLELMSPSLLRTVNSLITIRLSSHG